ncbi:HIT-like protein [Choiromyces venosus 120613-1]|uniref:HIT-like protein n=1 Tax=Choiromyces venosus 120613-1 TaxID=1336337 RepID=A0A3N4JM83_9PEZI|nr:HIT-like protein [Choiromyces venosus 120613-1]
MSSPCPFCLIATSYPPSTPPYIPAPPTAPLSPTTHILLSTPHALAFLDIMPESPGHLLLIPRSHYKTLHTLAPSLSAAVTAWLPLLARAATKVVGVSDFNVGLNSGVSAGQVVGHVHWHLVPRAGREEKERMEGAERRGVRGDLSDEEGERIAGLIREELGREVERLEGGERRILAVL